MMACIVTDYRAVHDFVKLHNAASSDKHAALAARLQEVQCMNLVAKLRVNRPTIAQATELLQHMQASEVWTEKQLESLLAALSASEVQMPSASCRVLRMQDLMECDSFFHRAPLGDIYCMRCRGWQEAQ